MYAIDNVLFITKSIITYMLHFPGYDLNGDGKVSIEEFKRVMIKTGRVSPEDIERMLGRADTDDDGYKSKY